jgi:hypothetical protein
MCTLTSKCVGESILLPVETIKYKLIHGCCSEIESPPLESYFPRENIFPKTNLRKTLLTSEDGFVFFFERA